MADKLRVVRAFTLPLGELSGLCVRSAGSGSELIAISDSSHVLVRGALGTGGLSGEFSTIDVEEIAGGGGGSQWEAVVADAAGRLYVLEENPGSIIVLSADLRQRIARIELAVDDDGSHARGWAGDENSRGEGIALLESGHFLVVKEKRPPLLVEFGPRGASPRGVSRELLRVSGGFPLPPGESEIVPLAAWTVDDADVKDVSDIAVTGDGRLFLLSDQSRCIVELDPQLPAAGGAVGARGRWQLPKRVSKPEGLVFLGDLTPLLVADDDEGEENLFVLEPLA